jgi:predicted dinucleotide-binding enzyme
MNIAIIGSGNVCGALSGNWARAGHGVTFGVRGPHAEKTRARETSREKFSSIARTR